MDCIISNDFDTVLVGIVALHIVSCSQTCRKISLVPKHAVENASETKARQNRCHPRRRLDWQLPRNISKSATPGRQGCRNLRDVEVSESIYTHWKSLAWHYKAYISASACRKLLGVTRQTLQVNRKYGVTKQAFKEASACLVWDS